MKVSDFNLAKAARLCFVLSVFSALVVFALAFAFAFGASAFRFSAATPECQLFAFVQTSLTIQKFV